MNPVDAAVAKSTANFDSWLDRMLSPTRLPGLWGSSDWAREENKSIISSLTISQALRAIVEPRKGSKLVRNTFWFIYRQYVLLLSLDGKDYLIIEKNNKYNTKTIFRLPLPQREAQMPCTRPFWENSDTVLPNPEVHYEEKSAVTHLKCCIRVIGKEGGLTLYHVHNI